MDSKAETGNNSRLGYMDIAKGIAILAVLAGHFCDLDSIPRMVMFSFHLPLFFIISGFFIKEINLQKTVCSGICDVINQHAAHKNCRNKKQAKFLN